MSLSYWELYMLSSRANKNEDYEILMFRSLFFLNFKFRLFASFPTRWHLVLKINERFCVSKLAVRKCYGIK